MSFKIVTAILAVAWVCGASPAFAQAQIQSEDVVKFFLASKQKTRGICIGTQQSCEGGVQKPSGLDMLVTFDLDSSDLTDEARSNLEEIVKALGDGALVSSRFIVEGYTDARGTESHNLGLSERRAEEVRKFLAANGIADERISSVGLGEGVPRVDDPLDPANRRVEMRLQLD